MKIKLAYGRSGLYVDLPKERTTVIEPVFVEGLPDERGAVEEALKAPIESRPLASLGGKESRVAIAVCDVTRPMPSHIVLPEILRQLKDVPKENVTILIATGTHRPSSRGELEQMLGPGVLEEFAVVNHVATAEEELEQLGRSPGGTPIWLNRKWVDADVRITTGFVEPHFFAGFSGGPKLVAPGLAGIETIVSLHSADLIGHPNSTWGIVEDNPLHRAIREIAGLTGVSFAVDVTINRKRQITSVFGGELFEEHAQACSVARDSAMQPVDHPFDIVVTTNSGYPLDLN
ncbi:MAG: nickel-dependent lactate racemase, partial [bacterium]